MEPTVITKKSSKNKWQFWIDRGGTFTDVIGVSPEDVIHVKKILTAPKNESFIVILEHIGGVIGSTGAKASFDENIDEIKLGTTLGTNALLEKKGARTVLVVTKGYRDLLSIGHQNRESLFSLNIGKESAFWESVVEVGGRINSSGKILDKLDENDLVDVLKKSKINFSDSVAVALINSHINPAHENLIAEELRGLGINHFAISHQSSPMIGYVDRANTAVVDAYLKPLLEEYVGGIKKEIGEVDFLIMQSHGGLAEAENFEGRNSILSGPAGGVIGAVKTAKNRGFNKIICFDMGGTSTDVAHYNGNYEYRSQSKIESITINSNSMDIHTVAAGGGSIVDFDGIRYKVGPESGGSFPGPACYGNGGSLTVTDCNVLIGIIRPEYFPTLFGKNKNSPIDRDLVVSRFEKIKDEAKNKLKEDLTIYQIAEGFLELAIKKMANAIKKISIDKGHDIKNYVLNCYGGAAAQHCCSVADSLSIKEIFISNSASVLSALGVGLSDRQIITEKSINKIFCDSAIKESLVLAEQIIKEKKLNFKRQNPVTSEIFFKLKFDGTSDAFPILLNDMKTMKEQFFEAFKKSYGFLEQDKNLFVESILVKTIEASKINFNTLSFNSSEDVNIKKTVLKKRIFEDGQWKDIPFYQLEELSNQKSIIGPAVIISPNNTVLIKTGWACDCYDNYDLLLRKLDPPQKNNFLIKSQKVKIAMEVAIFGNQIVSVAEQMGSALKKTATSINIKERLDYSCAIFDSEGSLLASAPHIPVHLGSMSDCVKALIKKKLGSLKPGQTYVTNDPFEGGTHLPDITCISPVFASGNSRAPVFFVASRGHHADIGGITPGSMPAESLNIQQEGILFKLMMAVEDNVFKEKEITRILLDSKYPARNIAHNIADLKAQIAANQTGINELQNKLIQLGETSITDLSKSLLNQGEEFVKKIIPDLNSGTFKAYLDEGQKIFVDIRVNKNQKEITFDFKNTSGQLETNFNAPKSITKACIIYVLRSLIRDKEIPLNDGCLIPVKLKIPKNSLLDPSYPAAVVAGNVEISQKIVDVILAALGVQAFSQGTMNNLSFGNSRFQYYETISGGSGAGKNYDGASARQTHMTNSRITDPEVMEYHFPVLLEEFSIRQNSGGKGLSNGGDGVCRKIKFFESVSLSILSSSRVFQPIGLDGGSSGLAGRNFHIDKAGGHNELPGCTQIEIKPGESILIYTPGGGGFGEPSFD